MTTHPTSLRSRQQGVVSMLITFIFLVIAGIVMLYTSRSAIVETRLSANEIRSKQAFTAAQAGLDHAIAYANNGGLDQDGSGSVDTLEASVFGTANGGSLLFPLDNNAAYRVAYCAAGSTITGNCANTRGGTFPPTGCTTPTNFTASRIVACGWSDDDSSRHLSMIDIQDSPATPDGAVTVPLITRGAANLLTGGASVFNYFNDLTTWSGSSFDGQSMTGKTFIRNSSNSTYQEAVLLDANNNNEFDFRETGNSPGCNNPPSGYVCSTQGARTGHDVVYGDTNLSSLSNNQFFQLFFGVTPTYYVNNIASYLVDLNNSLTTQNTTNINDVNGKNALSIWIAGDASLGSSVTVGTKDNPVVLIVDGNLTLGSGTTINGLVYVRGTLTGTGTPTIYGALIVAGNANATGNLKVIYDPNVLGTAKNTGRSSGLPGSWRDWQ